jgi:predicted amidophosphoribosyltransferase
VDTKAQNQLNREDRKNNLKNTFQYKKDLQDKNILLVDDVYTTGTTLNECSKALLKAHANNIYGLTLGR